jgi:hypothetical protein
VPDDTPDRPVVRLLDEDDEDPDEIKLDLLAANKPLMSIPTCV